MSLPLLVTESQVHIFNFYRDGAIYKAMSFRNSLYQLVDVLPMKSRQRAYELACQFGAQGDDVVITAVPTERCYRLWVDLRSAQQPTPVCQLPIAAESSTADSQAETVAVAA